PGSPSPRTELIGSAGLSTERDGEGPRHLPLLPLLVRSTDEVGGLFGGELRSGLQDLAHPRESGPEVGHQEGTYLASPAADRHRQLPPRNARETGLPEVAVQRVEDACGRTAPERSCYPGRRAAEALGRRPRLLQLQRRFDKLHPAARSCHPDELRDDLRP